MGWVFMAFGLLMFLLLCLEVGYQLDTNGSKKPKESPVLDRKARFKLYVQGEQQLMADWEAAFDPPRAALAADMKREMRRMKDDRYMQPQPVPTMGGIVWWEEQLDRDQCKLEADSLLQRRYITPQEYGQQIRNCNQEMQA